MINTFIPVLMLRVGKKIIHREANVSLLSERKNKDGSTWMLFKREAPSDNQKETIYVNSKCVLGF
jgi:hypothetical protein